MGDSNSKESGNLGNPPDKRRTLFSPGDHVILTSIRQKVEQKAAVIILLA